MAIFLMLLGILSCTKVLDKPDLSAIPDDLVWQDGSLSKAFLDNIYFNTLPGWPDANNHLSDEGGGGADFMYGQLTENSVNYWPYGTIRSINLLLQKIQTSPLQESEKNLLRGQALFMRSWLYFQLVSRYGGIPMILEAQELATDLNTPRSKTSDCITQIIADLDEATQYLPENWDANNEGRITRGAALAFKGRVLLHYASEQFNPTQIIMRWQDAYIANKQAYESLLTNGKKLMPSFRDLWFVEGSANTEAVMVTRYNNPGRMHSHDASIRPLEESQNYTGGDQPSLELVNAFPMKNGLPIDNPAAGFKPEQYWMNRDPRFSTTVLHNGDEFALSGKTGRRQWTFKGGEAIGGTFSGFYTRKTVFEGYKPFDAERSGTDWIEIRLAEVMLNYAEAANETGDPAVGYTMIKLLRARAGIDAGTENMYGLTPNMSKMQMRDAILTERRLELAFEGKRDQDLRRRRLYGSVLNGKKRTGLDITLIKYEGKAGTFFSEYAKGVIDLNSQYFDYFKETKKDLDQGNILNWRDNYYFYAIPRTHLEKNPNLEQTEGWSGGTFNPLL